MEQHSEHECQQERSTSNAQQATVPQGHAEPTVTKFETDKTQTNEIRDLQRRGERREVLTSLVAVIATVIAGAAWWTSERQLRVMRQQLDDARTDGRTQQVNTERALDAAKSQADSLKVLAESNRRTLGLIYRPHVAIEVRTQPLDPLSANLKDPSWQKTKFLGTVSLDGAGTVPVKNIKVDVRADILPFSRVPQFDQAAAVMRSGTIAGYSRLHTEFRLPNGARAGTIRPEFVADLTARKTRWWIYGRVTYGDEAGGCYWRTFAYVYAVPPPASGEPTEWHAYPDYTDEGECKEASAAQQMR